ncbi:MAG: hypothetical protein MI785_14880 [Kiloniellales bacterium]|nr:hypothetical protein [Kiloniellales bacterium]
MDDILIEKKISEGRQLYVAVLSRQAVVEAGAEHLGVGGFFIFETCDISGQKGINVLAKAASFDAAMRLVDLWAPASEPI